MESFRGGHYWPRSGATGAALPPDYRQVATVEAETLDQVFALTNHTDSLNGGEEGQHRAGESGNARLTG